MKKTDFDTKLISVNRKIKSNKTKHVLVKNKLKKLKTFDLRYFRGKNHFEENSTQNYLLFQSINRYFKRIIGVGTGECIYFWKSKSFSDKRINSITESNCSITPSIDYLGSKIRVKFNGSCLKQDKITYTHEKIVNIYTVYETSKTFNIRGYPTLENSLFGAVSLTKNVDIDKYKYFGYDI